MTAIIAIRVNDGIILAADSRTLVRRNSDGEPLAGYDQASKIHVIRDTPSIAFATCGAGSIGGLSMRFLAGELAESLRSHPRCGIRAYLEMASEVIRKRAEDAVCPTLNRHPDFDWLVGGFEDDQELPSLWRFTVRHGRPQVPERIEKPLIWSGDGAHAIDRLVGGVAPEVPDIIRQEVSDRPTSERLVEILGRLPLELVHPEMPLGDAVDLARLLMNTAIGIERFRGVVPTAGGEHCIAMLDRHRGFRYLAGAPL